MLFIYQILSKSEKLKADLISFTKNEFLPLLMNRYDMMVHKSISKIAQNFNTLEYAGAKSDLVNILSTGLTQPNSGIVQN